MEAARLHPRRPLPVRTLAAYLDTTGISSGPLFPGTGTSGRLGGAAVAKMLRRRAAEAGVDLNRLSGHSILRAGGITHLAERGLAEWKIQRISRHKTLSILRDYIRQTQEWADHETLAALRL